MHEDIISVMRDAHISGDQRAEVSLGRHLAEKIGAVRCEWYKVSPMATFALNDDPLGPMFEAIWVPAGKFFMGASRIKDSRNYEPGVDTDEGPVREVTITKGFWLGMFPVTTEQFCAVVKHSAFRRGFERHPITNVSWAKANEFCSTLMERLTQNTVRLPTEAEWEYAARGTDGRKYPWGEDLPTKRHAVFSADVTERVGTHPDGAGPFGHQDLAGNVWEWCQDIWADRQLDDVVDPCRSDSGSTTSIRVVRGGSCDSRPVFMRCSFRYLHNQGAIFNDIGFRVLLQSKD